MLKKAEIMNIIDEITLLLAKEGRTMNDEDYSLNVGQLQAFINVLNFTECKRGEERYTQEGLADNCRYWGRQRRQNREKAYSLDFFNKTAEELKAELKKAEEDEEAAYKVQGMNQAEIINAISRKMAAKYALNNIK